MGLSHERSYDVRTIVLVACCGKKLPNKCAARDLYQSTLFKKARSWAERHGDHWFILSAKYGLLSPDREIDPYDLTINGAPEAYRFKWSSLVSSQLEPYRKDRLIVLAGNAYCRHWTQHFDRVERPMQGLGIGEQLAWLTKRSLCAEEHFCEHCFA